MTSVRKRAQIGKEQEEKIALYALSPLYRDMTRTRLAEMIQTVVAWRGKPPEIEVLERKISEYRNISAGLEDKPWCLGESIKPEFSIPADTTAILLELWKYSLEIGYSFTLRHAKWASRLHEVVVTTRDDAVRWKQTQILFFTALQYADRERMSETLKQGRFETAIQDADLIVPFDPYETLTLQWFGILPVRPLESHGSLPVPWRLKIEQSGGKEGKGGGIEKRARQTLYDVVTSRYFNIATIAHVLHFPRGTDGDESNLEAFNESESQDRFSRIEKSVGSLSVEQQRAYAILVTCFSRGPKWNCLSLEDYFEIIEKLVQLISQHTQPGQILESVLFDFDRKNPLASYLKRVGLFLPKRHLDLFKMLGLA
jgi:hypothetical protein